MSLLGNTLIQSSCRLLQKRDTCLGAPNLSLGLDWVTALPVTLGELDQFADLIEHNKDNTNSATS